MGQVHGGSQEGTGGCNGDTEGAHPQSVQSLPKSQMLYSEPFPPSSQSPSSWWRHSWLQPPCVEDDNTSSASPHHQPPCSIHAEHSVGVSVAEDMKAHKNPATQPMMVQKARPRKRAARSSIGGTRHPVRSLASDEASPMTRSAHTLSFAKRAPRSPRSLPSPQPKSERSFFSTLLRLEKWVDTISATVCQDRLPESTCDRRASTRQACSTYYLTSTDSSRARYTARPPSGQAPRLALGQSAHSPSQSQSHSALPPPPTPW